MLIVIYLSSLAFLSADTASIDPVASTVAIGALLPQVDAALLLPQQTAAAQGLFLYFNLLLNF